MREQLIPFNEKMEKTLDVLAEDYASIRAGRANPGVLDRISVEYYGAMTPINQMAAISVAEARILVIQPWDRSSLKSIEKAINASDIGIPPQNDGSCIRLVFPPLTEERRKELCKQVEKHGEEAKVNIRNHRRDANDFFKKIGIGAGRARTAMIVGGGTIAYYLARRLLEVGIHTKIIDQDPARCEHLSELLPKASIICGDGTDERLLIQEGLENVDAFAALTGLDEENILLSLYAKRTSRAKVVTKINRINFSGVLSDIKLDTISYPRLVTADMIIKYARSMNESLNSNVENLYKLEDGHAEALEFYIKEDSAVTNVPLNRLHIRKNILVCSIVRGGQAIIPSGQDELHVGDYVVVVLTHARLNDIKDIIEG